MPSKNYLRTLKYRTKAKNRKKRNARRKVEYEIFMGRLKRGFCEIEGCLEKTEAHHTDYNKPLDIKWVCHKHHGEYHTKLNIKALK